MVDNVHAPSGQTEGLRHRLGTSTNGAATNGSAPVSSDEEFFGLESYVPDNSFLAIVTGFLKVFLCLFVLAINTSIWAVILLILLPWPSARLYQGNVYSSVTGRMQLWICGCPIKIRGREHSKNKAIYLCNHASSLDVAALLWIMPKRTVGIGKKELIWYPFFGILFALAGHLRIDRSNRESSIASMAKAAQTIIKEDLSLAMYPEGTRSKDGRLLPFKKGFVHMALQTKRPIVPVIITGAHLAWPKHSFWARPAPITITFLEPIKTDDWTPDKVNEYVAMIWNLYVKNLPACQKPLQMSATE